jgi:hypothetical protein
MNPNALPKSATLQDFQQFGDDINSSDYNDTLNAMQYMQGLRQPTGGLNRLPQVTVPMQEGGGMEEAIMEEQDMPIQSMSPEEQAMMMQQVEQEDPRQPNPEAQALAQQVASYGRGGDKLLLHIRPDELEGLSSMLTITINPTTGMPEAFINKLVRAGKRAVKGAAKGIKNVVKSDAFKTIAPIAFAIAAPYALAHFGAFGLTSVGAMSPLAFGATTGLGSLVGNLAAGRSFKDSAKAGLISGVTAGTMRGVSNKMAGKTFMGDPIQPDPIVANTSNSELIPKGSQTSFTGGGYEPSTATNVASGTPDVGTSYGVEVGPGSAPTASQQIAVADTYQNAPVGLDRYVPPSATPSYSPTPNLGGTIVPGGAPEGFDTQAFLKTADTTPIAGGFDQSVSSIPRGPGAPNLFQRTTSAVGEYVPQSVKDISGAIAQDYNPMTKAGLMNIASKGLAGDIGGSYVDLQNANEQAKRLQEEEDDRLRREGYTVEYPDGYGSQRVVYDSTGVVPVRTVAEILDRALGGGRYLYRGRTVYEPTEDVVETAQGGLISLGMGGFLDKIKTLMPTPTGKESNVTTVPTEEQQSEAFSNEATNIEDQQIIDEYLKVVREQPYEVEKVYAPGTGARRLLEEAFKARNMPLPFAQGGLISMARGGEFSGMVPGDGGGMEDNVYMPIKEGPEQVGTLAVSPSEYVVDSYTMAALGGGNPAEGAKVMDETIKNIRKKAYGNTKQPKEVDGLSALTPMVQGV